MPAPAPILHIGYHKTATTWFQRRVYPAVTNATMIPPDRVRDVFLGPRAMAFDVAAARAALATERRAIVCHEELSGSIHSAGLHGFLSAGVAARLHVTAPDGRVVIFLRHQVDIAASAYRQYVRVGGTYDPDRYLRPPDHRPHRAPLFDIGHVDYLPLIQRYVSLFGQDRVSLYLYEELRRDGRAFLARYLADQGLDADLDRIDLRPERPGYGDATLRLARLLNRFTRGEIPYKHYVVHVPGLHRATRRALERAGRSKVLASRRAAGDLLGPDLVAAIEARVAASNRRLATEFGLPLAEHGYPLAG